MKTISDIIEEFILSVMEGDDNLNISRNELAEHFDCAPSQINYVLSTRFTIDRGYLVESKRGGGGYITLTRIENDDNYIKSLVTEGITDSISNIRANQIVDRLQEEEVITQGECDIIKSAISDKAIFASKDKKDMIRASIMKSILMHLIAR